METIKIYNRAGSFAENKDVARDIRLKLIKPALEKNDQEIVIDFGGVTGATQSFIHALISQLVRDYSDRLFQRLLFKDCNPAIQQVINMVADYMTE